MKKVLFTGSALAVFLCLAVVLAGCAEGFPAGNWAISSDPEVSVLRVNEDGSALYRGAGYTWEDDGRFLLLKGTDEEVLRLRYQMTEKNVFLYVSNRYTLKEGTAGDGIVGVWNLDGSEQSFFEFTANGRFLEDGVFDGTYEVDETEGSFTLIYPMYFGNSVCFFERDGDHMIIEYPMSLRKITETP